jgi:hypothetical protein
VNNLDESRLVTWVVHTAQRFVERAKREARRRPLAAITQKFVDDSSSNIINTKKTVRTTGFSPRVDGIADGAAHNTLFLTGIPSNSQGALKRTARGAQLGEGNRGTMEVAAAAWCFGGWAVVLPCAMEVAKESSTGWLGQQAWCCAAGVDGFWTATCTWGVGGRGSRLGNGVQGFVLGAETMEEQRAPAGGAVARPRQEQGRGGWSSTLGAARDGGGAPGHPGRRAPWEGRSLAPRCSCSPGAGR